ncbi:hypothetical protein [Nocardioides jishulii]|uniref:Uncharacterized protein n=1 Tax=Nocardioides jishulii TaxID=2575440 RepID=A0A4U2YRM4_9ACTN|nr:hypothetical protein [Nocardioides jishulii]QCX26132.1 hypothetical protein FCL41_00180 [Nocardioides jishulii]TKI64069.1 hypothetical protein FC770_02530 [Nocardioides jishulii]
MSILKNAASLLCLATVVSTVSTVHADAAAAATGAASSCFAAPDASALGTARGRTLSTLHHHDGKVFYGYGDYDANTGSSSTPQGTNVSYFDPGTNEFTVAFPHFKSEEVNTFRTLSDGKLYVPNIDPSLGARATNGYATDADGQWADIGEGINSVHVFDVARVGQEVFVAGAHQPVAGGDAREQYRAVVWRSADGGRTFTESLVDTHADVTMRDGFERFYWLAVLDGKVYARADTNNSSPMMRFDPAAGGWEAAPGVTEPDFGRWIYDGHDVLTWKGRIWTAGSSGLRWYDGTTTGRVALPRTALPRNAAVGTDGHLYVLDTASRVWRMTHTSVSQEIDPVPFREAAAAAETLLQETGSAIASAEAVDEAARLALGASADHHESSLEAEVRASSALAEARDALEAAHEALAAQRGARTEARTALDVADTRAVEAEAAVSSAEEKVSVLERAHSGARATVESALSALVAASAAAVEADEVEGDRTERLRSATSQREAASVALLDARAARAATQDRVTSLQRKSSAQAAKAKRVRARISWLRKSVATAKSRARRLSLRKRVATQRRHLARTTAARASTTRFLTVARADAREARSQEQAAVHHLSERQRAVSEATTDLTAAQGAARAATEASLAAAAAHRVAQDEEHAVEVALAAGRRVLHDAVARSTAVRTVATAAGTALSTAEKELSSSTAAATRAEADLVERTSAAAAASAAVEQAAVALRDATEAAASARARADEAAEKVRSAEAGLAVARERLAAAKATAGRPPLTTYTLSSKAVAELGNASAVTVTDGRLWYSKGRGDATLCFRPLTQ